MTIYVAGPIVRGMDDEFWLGAVYADLEEALGSPYLKVLVPKRDENIDGMAPHDFHKAIVERIQKCDQFIGILAKSDQSVPVEATVANIWKKPISLISVYDPKRIPRMLMGLENVREAGHVSELTRIAAEVKRRAAGYRS